MAFPWFRSTFWRKCGRQDGALKGDGGRLDIHWTAEHGGDVPLPVLDWRESGVAMPADIPWRGIAKLLR